MATYPWRSVTLVGNTTKSKKLTCIILQQQGESYQFEHLSIGRLNSTTGAERSTEIIELAVTAISSKKKPSESKLQQWPMNTWLGVSQIHPILMDTTLASSRVRLVTQSLRTLDG